MTLHRPLAAASSLSRAIRESPRLREPPSPNFSQPSKALHDSMHNHKHNSNAFEYWQDPAPFAAAVTRPSSSSNKTWNSSMPILFKGSEADNPSAVNPSSTPRHVMDKTWKPSTSIIFDEPTSIPPSQTISPSQHSPSHTRATPASSVDNADCLMLSKKRPVVASGTASWCSIPGEEQTRTVWGSPHPRRARPVSEQPSSTLIASRFRADDDTAKQRQEKIQARRKQLAEDRARKEKEQLAKVRLEAEAKRAQERKQAEEKLAKMKAEAAKQRAWEKRKAEEKLVKRVQEVEEAVAERVRRAEEAIAKILKRKAEAEEKQAKYIQELNEAVATLAREIKEVGEKIIKVKAEPEERRARKEKEEREREIKMAQNRLRRKRKINALERSVLHLERLLPDYVSEMRMFRFNAIAAVSNREEAIYTMLTSQANGILDALTQELVAVAQALRECSIKSHERFKIVCKVVESIRMELLQPLVRGVFGNMSAEKDYKELKDIHSAVIKRFRSNDDQILRCLQDLSEDKDLCHQSQSVFGKHHIIWKSHLLSKALGLILHHVRHLKRYSFRCRAYGLAPRPSRLNQIGQYARDVDVAGTELLLRGMLPTSPASLKGRLRACILQSGWIFQAIVHMHEQLVLEQSGWFSYNARQLTAITRRILDDLELLNQTIGDQMPQLEMHVGIQRFAILVLASTNKSLQKSKSGAFSPYQPDPGINTRKRYEYAFEALRIRLMCDALFAFDQACKVKVSPYWLDFSLFGVDPHSARRHFSVDKFEELGRYLKAKKTALDNALMGFVSESRDEVKPRIPFEDAKELALQSLFQDQFWSPLKEAEASRRKSRVSKSRPRAGQSRPSAGSEAPRSKSRGTKTVPRTSQSRSPRILEAAGSKLKINKSSIMMKPKGKKHYRVIMNSSGSSGISRAFRPSHPLRQPQQSSSSAEHGLHSLNTRSYPDPKATPKSSDRGESSALAQVEDHFGQLRFKLSQDALNDYNAKTADDTIFYSHQFYRNETHEGVPVYYCKTFQRCEEVAGEFLTEKIVGFDLEWRPNATATMGIKNNVSLVQVSSSSRIALFHLALHKGRTIEEIMPPNLRKLIESESIIKTGVSILADCTRLKQFFDVEAHGLIELSHLHNLVLNRQIAAGSITKRLESLARQVKTHLQMPMAKGEVRMSEWHQPLTFDQCAYAATDAWAAVCLFYELEKKRLMLDPVPPRPPFAELKQTITGARKIVAGGDEEPVASEGVVSEDKPGEEASSDWESVDEDESDEEPINDNFMEDEAVQLPAETSSEGEESIASDPSDGPDDRTADGMSVAISSPPHSSLELATAWVTSYMAGLHPMRKLRVGAHTLHAYTLFHHQAASLPHIAAALVQRGSSDDADPSIAAQTLAATHILEAIVQERLPFDLERIKEILEALPTRPRERYRKMGIS